MSKIKIGLFGFGVVGQGIYQVVQKSKNAHAEIVKICVRDPESRVRSKSTNPSSRRRPTRYSTTGTST